MSFFKFPHEGLTLEYVLRPLGLLSNPILPGALLLTSLQYPHIIGRIAAATSISGQSVWASLWVLAATGSIFRGSRYLSWTLQNNGLQSSLDVPREIAVVTGGCSGIGALIVSQLAARGMKVVILDVSDPRNPLPDNVHFYNVDIVSADAVTKTADSIRKEIGKPTILVCNAGVGFNKPILEESPQQVQTTFNVNIVAQFILTQAFLPAMIESDHGHIIITASMASFVTHAGNVDYACTKAACVAFHEGLALELKHIHGAKRVRTSIVHPTWVRTPLIAVLFAKKHFNDFMLEPETVADAVVEQIFKNESGKLVIPARYGIVSTVRAWPNWLQQILRDSFGDHLVRP